LWTYRAALLEVTDGDTLRVLLDTGFHGRQQEDLRLVDVWAPELRDEGGPEAQQFVTAWMGSLVPTLRWPLLVATSPNTNPEPEERRTFTRYVADVWDVNQTRHLNADLRTYLGA
jgi:hypothetical protein